MIIIYNALNNANNMLTMFNIEDNKILKLSLINSSMKMQTIS